MDREGDRWGEPRNLGAPVNTDQAEYFPAVTDDGTLYFTRADAGGRLHRDLPLPAGGRAGYQEPELLPVEVNCGTNRFNATISPDESRLILSGGRSSRTATGGGLFPGAQGHRRSLGPTR